MVSASRINNPSYGWRVAVRDLNSQGLTLRDLNFWDLDFWDFDDLPDRVLFDRGVPFGWPPRDLDRDPLPFDSL